MTQTNDSFNKTMPTGDCSKGKTQSSQPIRVQEGKTPVAPAVKVTPVKKQ